MPPRQQYKVLDQLVSNAERNQDPKGDMQKLAGQFKQRHVSYLNIALIEANDDLNKPNAGDPVTELAEALRLDEVTVDSVLGSYAEELARDTNPRQNYGGGTM
jgi:hypothetical protein